MLDAEVLDRCFYEGGDESRLVELVGGDIFDLL